MVSTLEAPMQGVNDLTAVFDLKAAWSTGDQVGHAEGF